MAAKETLRKMLSEGRNDRLVEGLLFAAKAKADSSFLKDVESYAGRYNTLKRDRLGGIVDEDFYHRQLNNIRLSAQELIDQLPDCFIPPGWSKFIREESNAMEISDLLFPVPFVPVPALATGKARLEVGPPNNDTIIDKIKDSCVLEIEKKLRKMANHYFDDNGFERPKVTGTYFIQSYLTLQGLKLKEIETKLRTISTVHHDFFQPVKMLSDELKAHCTQLTELMDNKACLDFPIKLSLEKTVMVIELLEEELPTLIADRSVEKRGAFKSNYLIPLADQMHQLQEKMSGFDVGPPKAGLN